MGERVWRSLRARTTAGATLVVAVVLIAGAVLFSEVLSASVLGAAERAAQTRADELTARGEASSLSDVADLDDDIAHLDDEVAQIVDGEGDVVVSSEDAEGTTLPFADGWRIVQLDDEPMLVVSEDLDDDRHLVVGVPVEDDLETLSTVRTLLLLAVPLVLLVVGATIWSVVGRALRPVARMRAEVDDITAERLDRRVPVPDSGDEIAGLAITMNGMLDRLDESASAQRRFVSDASHELRSPLATIRQHAELAQAHPEVTSVSELAGVVHDEGLRLQGLVDALLLLARLDEAEDRVRESVDLDDIALAEASRLRSAGLSVDGSGIGAARVTGDPRLFGQLVRNLADNAARHARSRVAITLAARGEQVVLTVEDDGEGIPRSERDRVFERFVRLDEARARDAGGSGLGLAIVRGITVAADGSITVDESRWEGARFTATFPAGS